MNSSGSALARMARIREYVELLCSARFAGRSTASPGGKTAMLEIERRFAALGLCAGAPDGSFRQPIPASGGCNVMSRLRGTATPARAIVVEAHYDHLGVDAHGDLYPGADDNAAAVAIVLEAARELADAPSSRSRDVWICAFDAEESPHFLTEGMGARHFLDEPPLPLSSIDMFICLDLCGHAVGPAALGRELRDTLFVLGAERSQGTAALLDGLGDALRGVSLRRLGLDLVPYASDYAPFHSYGIPVLFLTCGRWPHYHRPSDTPDRLDYEKIDASVDALVALIRALDARPERTRFTRGGVDHAASLATLRAFGVALAKIRPGLSEVLRDLDKLEALSAKSAEFGARHLALLMSSAERIEAELIRP